MKKKICRKPKVRKAWLINPRSRVKGSLKRYNRRKSKKGLTDTLKRADDEEEA